MLDTTWEFVDSYATSLLLPVHLDRIQQEAALQLTKAEALQVLKGPIHYVAGRCPEGTTLEYLHQKLTPYVEAVLAMSEQELALEAKEPDFSCEWTHEVLQSLDLLENLVQAQLGDRFMNCGEATAVRSQAQSIINRMSSRNFTMGPLFAVSEKATHQRVLEREETGWLEVA